MALLTPLVPLSSTYQEKEKEEVDVVEAMPLILPSGFNWFMPMI